jgi:hypothetical protein
MSGILSGLRKFFTKDRTFIFIGFILLCVVLMYYSNGKTSVFDSMEDGSGSAKAPSQKKDALENIVPSVPAIPTVPSIVQGFQSASYNQQDVANPSELLPKDTNKDMVNQWASLNPVSQNNPQIPDLLQAGYHIGLDTIGQTMKNANLQLRSDPIIQKSDIGPWNQSTIEPDLMRVPLEVGSSIYPK